MAGEAKTGNFMLATATVMVGTQADLYNLNPDAHSIGLVKNFSLTTETGYVELTQGLKGTIVDSQMNANSVRGAMEVYEYTSRNMAYALGLDGHSTVGQTEYLSTAEAAAAATTVAIADAAFDATYLTGDWVGLQNGSGELVHVVKLSADATNDATDTTLVFTDHPVPTGMTFPIGSKVAKFNVTEIGSKENQPFMSIKVIAPMANGGKPLILLFPKVRITQGFNLNFQTDAYGNMPFEFTPYDLTASDNISGGPQLFDDFGTVPVKQLSSQ